MEVQVAESGNFEEVVGVVTMKPVNNFSAARILIGTQSMRAESARKSCSLTCLLLSSHICYVGNLHVTGEELP